MVRIVRRKALVWGGDCASPVCGGRGGCAGDGVPLGAVSAISWCGEMSFVGKHTITTVSGQGVYCETTSLVSWLVNPFGRVSSYTSKRPKGARSGSQSHARTSSQCVCARVLVVYYMFL